jgi:hypothetical protein
MKLTTGTLVLGMTLAAAAAWGQNPNVIQNTRNTLNAVQQHQAAESNAALAATQGQTVKVPPVHRPAPAKRAVTPRRSTAVISPAPTPAPQPPATTAKPEEAPGVAVAEQQAPDAKSDRKKTFVITGKRDPFLSPVVNRSALGSGCNTGKKCLAIDQISLRGVVKSEAGMIAVVVNAMDKAYFLHENDPVFNGYVVKITGDSIVFKETVQDQLGKPVIREVTKKIMTPAV